MSSCEIEIGWAIRDLEESDERIARADGSFQKRFLMNGFLQNFPHRYVKLDCDCYDAMRLNAALEYLENPLSADSYDQFKKILLGQD